MRPLMELSATLDTYRPNSAALFRSISAGSKSELILNDGELETFSRFCYLLILRVHANILDNYVY